MSPVLLIADRSRQVPYPAFCSYGATTLERFWLLIERQPSRLFSRGLEDAGA